MMMIINIIINTIAFGIYWVFIYDWPSPKHSLCIISKSLSWQPYKVETVIIQFYSWEDQCLTSKIIFFNFIIFT